MMQAASQAGEQWPHKQGIVQARPRSCPLTRHHRDDGHGQRGLS